MVSLRKSEKLDRVSHNSIYLMRKLAGLDNKEIGGVFGMNSSAVSKAAISIENGIDKDSRLRKEVKRLFSIFEG